MTKIIAEIAEFEFANVVLKKEIYWPGRHYIYCKKKFVAGTVINVREGLYNFIGLNEDFKQKIFGTVNLLVPYDEIWWFYPCGDSQECNAAMVFFPDSEAQKYNFYFQTCFTYGEEKQKDFWEKLQNQIFEKRK